MRYLFFLTVMFSVSCSNENEQNGTLVETKESNKFIAIDSLFYSQFPKFADTLVAIKGQEVSSFYAVINELDIEGYFYDVIPEFLRIDSLKKADRYEDYISHIDIGQLQEAKAYQIKNVNLSESKLGKIWGIYYGSYEACPAYSGDDIFLTILEKNIPISTILIGSNYGVVDPPMAFESLVSSKKEGDLMIITLHQKEIEIGESTEDFDKILEENHQTFTFDIKNVKFIK